MDSASTSFNPEMAQAQGIHQGQQRNRQWVRRWLYLICLMVFAMVLVGGATRLTDSGLSITEWKPVHGIIPPLSAADWQAEFAKYRQIPEYKQINLGMTLAEFKVIYWWEWGHRFIGRIIGFVFIFPFIFFWWRGMLEPGYKPKLLLLLGLGGLQGFIGWWMVSSGLVDRVDVSQYRLAIHLTLAAIIFAYGLWLARSLTIAKVTPPLGHLPLLAMVSTIALLFQIFLGALVAGLDAGLASNEWPLMLGAIIPQGISDFEPLWRNWFENPISVQFNHRIVGYVAVVLFIVQWLASRRQAPMWSGTPRAALIALLGLAQMMLGVVNLWLEVPVHAALAHQGLAILLLGLCVVHWQSMTGLRRQA